MGDSTNLRSPHDFRVEQLEIMGFAETPQMSLTRISISKALRLRSEADGLTEASRQLIDLYRSYAERQLDQMDAEARSRAMVGFLLLRAEAYRQSGWLSSWQQKLVKAKENAHYINLLDQLEESKAWLWRNAMLNIILVTPSAEEGPNLYHAESGTVTPPDSPTDLEELNDDDLKGAVYTTLIEFGEDPEDFLAMYGLDLE